MTDLLPCPFCGSKWTQTAEFIRYYAGISKMKWHGVCTDCGATTRDCESEDEAIRLWNSRNDESAMRGPVLFKKIND